MEVGIKVAGRLLSFLISTSIFLAISGILKLYLAFLLYRTPPRTNLLLATFLMIFSVYNLNKLTDFKEDEINNPERVRYIKRFYRTLRYSIGISFVAAIVLSIATSPWAVLVMLFPVITGILYSIKLSPNIPRLKDITGVKNLIIALTWANGTAFLPYLTTKASLSVVALVYYYFFMKSIINTILFDVRDIEGDRLNGIRTIPVKLGVERTRILLLGLNTTLLAWLLIAFTLGYFEKYIPALLFSIINGYAYILYFTARTNPGKLLDLWVDGEWFYTTPLAILVTII
ncbi:UbiA family prenyltransferase [Thermococcus sp.]